jgi:ABC-type Fe3+/spermidine/putrescine transport system ATPase subunit
VRVAHFFRNDNLLPGTRRGNMVETALGTLQIDAQKVTQPDGKVFVTVRPEDVRLIPTANDMNCVEAKVLLQVYMGTHTQIQLDVAGQTWLVHSPADYRVQAGDTITIQLPASHIWLLPVG